MHKKKGFTLLEIIIVVIIAGVLVSLSLTKLFKMVEGSRLAEAYSMMSSMRTALQRCHSFQDNYANCDSWDVLGFEDPSNNPGSHFNYAVVGQKRFEYYVHAQRNTLDGGDGTSSIFLVQSSTNVWYYGTGAYKFATQY